MSAFAGEFSHIHHEKFVLARIYLKHIFFKFSGQGRSPRRLSPAATLIKGGKYEKKICRKSPGKKVFLAFSLLNKGGCPEDKGDLGDCFHIRSG